MEYMQVELYKRIEDDRRADQRRDAELWRLLRLDGRRTQHWRVPRRYWLLCQIGRWMVRLGQELQRIGT
jgi:hypothetical protein